MFVNVSFAIEFVYVAATGNAVGGSSTGVMTKLRDVDAVS